MMVSMIVHKRPRPRPRNTSTSKLPLLPLIAVSILLLSSLCTNIVAALDYGEKDVEVNANANANDIVNVNAIVEEEKEIEEEEEEEEKIVDGTIKTKRVEKDVNIENDNNNNNNDSNFEKKNNCQQSTYEPSILSDPCKLDKTPISSISSSDSSNSNNNEPLSLFSILFPTQYGDFVADCDRRRAPVQAERIYRLAKYGYYNQNYFFRVIPGKYIQFGTNGDPTISNMYNYNYNYNYNNTSTTTTTTTEKDQLLSNNNCSIIQPQPPYMAREIPGLSNSFGTISMSTSYKDDIAGYPNGVTWNATAELFINIGNNDWLDSNLFVPICTINKYDMNNVVLKFPSFGELFELGGDGPSLDLLYQNGNNYIESNTDTNPTWHDTMAITSIVSICDKDTSSSSSSSDSDSDHVVERDDEF